MATWNEFRNLIKNNYDVQLDNGDSLRINEKLSDGRSQMVIISRQNSDSAGVLAQFYSPVGTIKKDDLDEALNLLNVSSFGGLVKIEDIHFVKHCLPIEDLSPKEWVVPLAAIAVAADNLEKRFIGKDIF